MKNIFLVGLLLGLLMVGMVGTADATLLTFTDESEYLSAISSYDIFTEGFETTDWDASRPDGTASITSQGLTWTASDLIATNNGFARNGSYGVYDSVGDPDAIFSISSAFTIYGVGGWFIGTAPGLTFSLDSTDVFSGTLNIFSHKFFGVIETDGFTSFALTTSRNHWGADDFTFASGSANPIPEPSTIFLLFSGMIGLIGVNRRG